MDVRYVVCIVAKHDNFWHNFELWEFYASDMVHVFYETVHRWKKI